MGAMARKPAEHANLLTRRITAINQTMKATSPFAIRNIRLFIAFRIFFNSRFYYPVFTILFLDYGLTLEQFALLNTVWAITIVCCEVPSGAFADLLGRKRLLVLTSALMIVEISVIAFVPISSITVVFWAFLINRILSGMAEAMASGADEAIAYDSLVEDGNPEHWPQVLSLQMRLKALAGMLSMTSGALLYDPEMVNRFLAFLGMTVTVVPGSEHALPGLSHPGSCFSFPLGDAWTQGNRGRTGNRFPADVNCTHPAGGQAYLAGWNLDHEIPLCHGSHSFRDDV